jgi:chromosome partitioning protein
MTQTISILNQKGGVGKTTITSNLGEAFKRSGFSILLVDSDPQGSLRDWNEASEGDVLPVVGLDRVTLAKDIQAIKSQYDLILIDGAPQSGKLAAAAIKAADLVLIPVTPSPYDVWACSDLVEALKARQEVAEGKPPARFIISRARKNTRLSGDLAEALSGYEIPTLQAGTIHREIYAQTAADGLTVFHDKHASDAISEIDAIKNEIMEILNNGI